MVDSLSLDLLISASDELRNFDSVEKGAGTPYSAQGTHLENMAEGYLWTGTPHPPTPTRRKAEAARNYSRRNCVLTQAQHHLGWYAGIEFSGRTRIRLRTRFRQREVRPGTESRPRPVPHPARFGRQFRITHSISGHIRGWSRRRGQSAPFMGARRFGQPDYLEGPEHFPFIRGKQQLGQRHWPWTEPSPCA